MTSSSKKPGVPDAVRRAVDRTFQSTVGSAAMTRERAQELADDVLRSAEKRAARAGRGVREAGSKRRDAAAGVGDRVREAVAELRGFGSDDLGNLRAEIDALRQRIEELERKLAPSRRTKQSAAPKRPTTSKARTAARPKSAKSAKPARGQAGRTRRPPGARSSRS